MNNREVVYVERDSGIGGGAAAILTLLVPGLGQLCQGRWIIGPFAFCMVAVGYLLFVLPGMILHVLAIIDAAQYRPRRRRR